MDDGKLDALGQTIVSALGGAASAHAVAFNQLTVTVEAGKIVEVMKYLRDDPALRFVNITDVTAATTETGNIADIVLNSSGRLSGKLRTLQQDVAAFLAGVRAA